jgi:Yip1 domain
MKPLIANMIGAGRLNIETYERVEADPRTTWDSVLVVVLSSIAAGLGSGITGVVDVLALITIAVLTWLIWVGLTYVIGSRLLATPETEATFGQVMRTTGFSAAPGIFRVFGFLPVIGWPIFLGATVWMLFSFVVAVRQALDFKSTARAFAVCLLGWLIHGVLLAAFVLRAI